MRQFNHSEKCLKPEYILVAVVTLFSLSVSETMADDYFSPDSIEIRGNVSRDIDLSQFSHTGGQAPVFTG
jgi:outer membrane usher protein